MVRQQLFIEAALWTMCAHYQNPNNESNAHHMSPSVGIVVPNVIKLFHTTSYFCSDMPLILFQASISRHSFRKEF